MRKRRKKAIRDVLTAGFVLLLAAVGIFAVLRIIAPEKFDIFPVTDEKAEIYRAVMPEGELQVHVIDVDQADSVLIRSAGGNILIDAGTNDSEQLLKAHLYACGIRSIDYLICTHPHSDHIGGADMVIDEFDVKTVLLTDMESTESSFERLLDAIEATDTNAEIPSLGDTYRLGDISFTVLAPVNITDDANNMSLAIKLVFGETSFLFTGDSESEAELSMLEHFGTKMLDCDFYKVGHHGSDTSSSEQLLTAVTPQIAAISCGKDNAYGHPRGEVLERLKASGCEIILRTDKTGTAVVKSDGRSLTVLAPE